MNFLDIVHASLNIICQQIFEVWSRKSEYRLYVWEEKEARICMATMNNYVFVKKWVNNLNILLFAHFFLK